MAKYIVAFSLLYLLLNLLNPIHAQQQSQTDEEMANWIMAKVIENGKKNEIIKRENIRYDKLVIKHDMRKSPPEYRGYDMFSIYGQNGESMEKLIEKNGRKENGEPKKSNLNFDEIIAERFVFQLAGEEVINGRGYFIISFKPKEPIEDLPFNERLDEGINRMRGTIYVDIEKLYLWKLEGSLIDRFNKGLGIFRMRGFQIAFEQEEVFGIIVPKSMTVRYQYRLFFSEIDEKLEYSYRNHIDKRFIGPSVPSAP